MVFNCKNCKEVFNCDKHDIYTSICTCNPTYKFYKTPEFQKWLDIWDEECKNWVIYKNSLYRFFSQSAIRVFPELNKTIIDEKVLELGCGNGRTFNYNLFKNYYGVDINHKSLQHFKKYYPLAKLFQSSLNTLPFDDNSFSKVICFHTLEHLYDIAGCLEEIHRILKPGGKFYYAIPTEGTLLWSIGRFFITRPHLRKKYNLSCSHVMYREHINDYKRVLKFLDFYFTKTLRYWPLYFIKYASFNSLIYGICTKE